LHAVGVAHVGELRLAVAAGGLDGEVARADDPLPHALMEVDVVDALERDLDAVPREDAGAEDGALIRDHEEGTAPLEELHEEPDGPHHGRRADGVQDDVVDRVVVDARREHQPDDERDAREDVLGEEPPVRTKVERDGFALVDQMLRVRHRGDSRCGLRGLPVRRRL